jgi:hypothetical protein
MNRAAVEQNGIGNRAEVTQIGANLTVVVRQYGNNGIARVVQQ